MSAPGEGARRVAVLASGGVDSAVLVADRSYRGEVVQPIYIRFGLAWEVAEEEHLRRFLDSLPADCRSAAARRTRVPGGRRVWLALERVGGGGARRGHA